MGGQRGGAPPNEKAATRGRGSGQSRKPSATRTVYTATASKARQPAAGEVVIYDGLAAVGHLLPRGSGHWLAYSDTGRFLGQFGSDRVAAQAVYKAHRPGGEA